jgi:hypothetical protein
MSLPYEPQNYYLTMEVNRSPYFYIYFFTSHVPGLRLGWHRIMSSVQQCVKILLTCKPSIHVFIY